MEAALTPHTGVANNPVVQLRQRATFWQAQHARAIKREATLEQRVQQLEKERNTLRAQLTEKNQQIEALKAKLTYFQQQLFGRKSEQADSPGTSRGRRDP